MYPTEKKPEGRKISLPQNVLDAATERISMLFDRYENIVYSVSGGKDSTVLAELVQREASRRGRAVHPFFLDQEAEYESTIEIIRRIMYGKGVIPHWLQCPVRMTNATSYEEEFLYAWGPGEEWMRAKEPIAITEATGAPDRFYPLIDWFERQWGPDTAFLVGLRSEESLNRFGAVTRNPGVDNINWSSKGSGHIVKFYPLYDWTFEDIWTFIGTEGVPYNRVYDWMWVKGHNIQEMRVSNLVHERAFKINADLQEFEPNTYDRLLKRIKGVHTAALYAKEQTVYQTRKLPPRFKTWRAYRDFLLDTFTGERKETFLNRFAGQKESESVFRQQTRQLLINDWENNVPVVQVGERENPLKKWMDIL